MARRQWPPRPQRAFTVEPSYFGPTMVTLANFGWERGVAAVPPELLSASMPFDVEMSYWPLSRYANIHWPMPL